MRRAVIFSTAYFPLVGGAEVAMKEITDRLPDWKFDLICARIKPGLGSTEKIGNVTVHRVGFGRPFDKFLLPFFGPLAALRISSFQSLDFARDRLPTSNFQLPIIWSLMASFGGFAALVYTWLRPKSKFLLTLQEGDPLEHYAKRAGCLRFLHKKIFQRADAVQAISRFLADWAVKMGFKGTPEVVPNGVDVGRFTARITPEHRVRVRLELGLTEGDSALVTVSRLSLKNGVDDLIRSLTFLPANFKAVIVGDGEDREKLRVLTEQKGLMSRVRFLGAKPHDELPAILQSCDIFVRPSLSEGLGNAFLEAMASGLPVVGTPVGGIPDFLIDGETGVFCRPSDPESVAAAVRRILQESGLRERLVANGERLVREKYDWRGIAARMGRLLEQMAV